MLNFYIFFIINLIIKNNSNEKLNLVILTNINLLIDIFKH